MSKEDTYIIQKRAGFLSTLLGTTGGSYLGTDAALNKQRKITDARANNTDFEEVSKPFSRRIITESRPIIPMAANDIADVQKQISTYSYKKDLLKRTITSLLGAAVVGLPAYGVAKKYTPEGTNTARNIGIAGAAIGAGLGYSKSKMNTREKYEEPYTRYKSLRAWFPQAAMEIDKTEAYKLSRLKQLQDQKPFISRLIGNQ